MGLMLWVGGITNGIDELFITWCSPNVFRRACVSSGDTHRRVQRHAQVDDALDLDLVLPVVPIIVDPGERTGAVHGLDQGNAGLIFHAGLHFDLRLPIQGVRKDEFVQMPTLPAHGRQQYVMEFGEFDGAGHGNAAPHGRLYALEFDSQLIRLRGFRTGF
jgi:hypothetical protein